MIKKNIPLIVITSLITILPGLFMKSILSLFLLAVHLICIYITSKDKGNQEQSKKVLRKVFWICPVIAVYISGLNYLMSVGKYTGIEEISMCFFGFLFVIIGNFLPKCRMNATIGIKIPWAYSSEENWNRTHRFGGKVWVVCGLLMMFTVFMPANIGGTFLVSLFLIMILVPTIYSWLFYKKELKEGKASLAAVFDKAQESRKTYKTTGIFLIVTFALVAVLMFMGKIEYIFEEETLTIKADFWGDMSLDYDEIESVEYLEEDIAGLRTGGYGSARLLMGTFRNEEYDYYTRYSYTKCDTGIKLDFGGKVMVISAENEEKTKELYNELVEIVDK